MVRGADLDRCNRRSWMWYGGGELNSIFDQRIDASSTAFLHRLQTRESSSGRVSSSLHTSTKMSYIRSSGMVKIGGEGNI